MSLTMSACGRKTQTTNNSNAISRMESNGSSNANSLLNESQTALAQNTALTTQSAPQNTMAVNAPEKFNPKSQLTDLQNNLSQVSNLNKVIQQPKPEKQCFEIQYSHADMPAHEDGEACAHHKNLLKLPTEIDVKALHKKSICVRVDNKPVNFRLREKDLIIDPMGRYRAQITVQYCLGNDTCNQPCQVPKDEFLSALGADTPTSPTDSDAVVWNTHGAKSEIILDETVKRELAQLEESETQKHIRLFSGWQAKTVQPFCRR